MDEPEASPPPSPLSGETATPPAPRVGTPECPGCGTKMRFDGGEATHDLYAERYVCPNCGRITYRSFGRGSVS